MKYIKTTFSINPDNEPNREILVAYLSELDFESFDSSSEKLEAFFPTGAINSEEIRTVLKEVPFRVDFEEEEMPDINWNEEWEKNYFQPLLINEKVLIRAPFHKEYPQADYEIIIEPNMAFGTGNHETTSMMVEHLLEIDIEGKTILDMGCGTGVLGILASTLGAEKVTAIDISEWAYEGTLQNSKLNNIKNIDTKLGDATLLDNESYDLILANIQKNIILQDIKKYVSVLNEDGLLVLSGFYKQDLEDIVGKASELFLSKLEIKEGNKWVAVSFRK